MLTVKKLSKQIDGETILENIDFEVNKGTIVGLVGRNGVGKTTLMKIIVGILDPSKGEVLLHERNIHTHPEVKKSMYYLPDSFQIFNGYKVKEIVKLHKAIYEKFDESKFISYMERFKLPFNRSLRSFSKGMKALLFILLSVASNTDLIILDEPTNGLDAIVKKSMMQLMIEEVSERQVSLLISTHHLEELEKIADKILMLKDSKLDMEFSLDQAKHQFTKIQVALDDQALEAVSQLPNVEIISQIGRVATLLIKGNVEQTVARIRQLQPLLLEELPMTLEDVFVSALGGEERVS